MAEPLIAEIKLFGGNFAPRAWAFCEGQLLAISSNTALFSLLGTTYGGDGRTTFALPDLRGRVAVHPGRGPGLSSYRLGERGGQEEVTLTLSQLANHGHLAVEQTGTEQSVALGTGSSANEQPVEGNIPSEANFTDGIATKKVRRYGPPTAPKYVLGQRLSGTAGLSLNNTGGGQPHTNIRPIIAMNHVIAMFGIYPSRS